MKWSNQSSETIDFAALIYVSSLRWNKNEKSDPLTVLVIADRDNPVFHRMDTHEWILFVSGNDRFYLSQSSSGDLSPISWN
jgi:hypothetical protein